MSTRTKNKFQDPITDGFEHEELKKNENTVFWRTYKKYKFINKHNKKTEKAKRIFAKNKKKRRYIDAFAAEHSKQLISYRLKLKLAADRKKIKK